MIIAVLIAVLIIEACSAAILRSSLESSLRNLAGRLNCFLTVNSFFISEINEQLLHKGVTL
ncbi:hypothetical protein [Anoxynatronum buryatiense]|uniref:Uncharacterized protein n=1 Tax=Anoxynatronum buryatiense TaxID=489973 RepID=A0AA45WWL9_9CLOT|nr:hypothetical protein [Anoxynatronum buryatiense]SMP54730.1 hypothetical protein SAMN06296020_105154 [Anoxynatronum buryatiense]